MEYVFGGALVCADAETAKLLTFHPDIRSKCVTLEGDVYDPSGTLSGGSASSSSGVLEQLEIFNVTNAELQNAKAKLNEIDALLTRESARLQTVKEITNQLSLKKHELKITEQQVASNSFSKTIQNYHDTMQLLEKLKDDLSECLNEQKSIKDGILAIENDIREFKNNKGSKLEQLKDTIAKMRKDLDIHKAMMKDKSTVYQDMVKEKTQLEEDLKATQDQLEEVKSGLNVQIKEYENLKEEYGNAQTLAAALESRLKEEKKKVNVFNDEIHSLETTKKKKNALIKEVGLESQKIKHELEKSNKDLANLKEALAHLMSENEWVQDECKYFGQPNTPYDFEGVDLSSCKKNVKVFAERVQKMKRQINPKVMNMIDTVEKREASLKQNLKTVVKDKKKIEDTIDTLDKYKLETLENTWKKVNGYANKHTLLLSVKQNKII